jgi:HEPN domain-containing protein
LVSTAELRRISTTRLGDAKILLKNGRFDGAGYLCGYAMELALKLKVCQFRNWEGQPENEREDPSYQILRTHNLNGLMQLTSINVQREIKGRYFTEWSIIRSWRPEARYHPIGSVTRGDAAALLQAADTLLKLLIP